MTDKWFNILHKWSNTSLKLTQDCWQRQSLVINMQGLLNNRLNVPVMSCNAIQTASCSWLRQSVGITTDMTITITHHSTTALCQCVNISVHIYTYNSVLSVIVNNMPRPLNNRNWPTAQSHLLPHGHRTGTGQYPFWEDPCVYKLGFADESTFLFLLSLLHWHFTVFTNVTAWVPRQHLCDSVALSSSFSLQ